MAVSVEMAAFQATKHTPPTHVHTTGQAVPASFCLATLSFQSPLSQQCQTLPSPPTPLPASLEINSDLAMSLDILSEN